jgi:hypothetical protein
MLQINNNYQTRYKCVVIFTTILLDCWLFWSVKHNNLIKGQCHFELYMDYTNNFEKVEYVKATLIDCDSTIRSCSNTFTDDLGFSHYLSAKHDINGVPHIPCEYIEDDFPNSLYIPSPNIINFFTLMDRVFLIRLGFIIYAIMWM